MNALRYYMTIRGYTYSTLSQIMTARFNWTNCENTLKSYGTGRRKLSSATAKRAMELAIALDDPDQPGTDYERYMSIMYNLINNLTPT